jgi:CIC family chloride channel protein
VAASNHTRLSRQLLLSCLAVPVGLAGGVVGFLFVRATALLLNLSLQHRFGWQFPPLDHLRAGWWLLPEALAGGAVVAVLAAWEPLIRGHGIPEAMEAVLVHQSRIGGRPAVAKPLASIVAIGTGAPFGAEGPVILTGSALGSLLGQAVKVSPSERKVLLAAGAAAGMSAIFGAPIGAVLLAIELLLFEFSPRVLVPIVIASVFADGVHVLLIGQGPLFPVPPHNFAGLAKLPFYVVLGVVCGVLGVVITRGAYAMEDAFGLLPVKRFWHPIIGAGAVALIGLAVPRALGVGYGVIGETLGARLAVATLLAVFAGKLVMWCIAIGSGSSGSSLAPLLLVGASAGGLVGTALAHLFPGAGISPGGFAVVGMAATFGAAAGAPFTSMVLAFEITRDYNIILPLMLATVVAHLLARSLYPETLMTEKLARRGILVSQRYEVDLQRTTPVREVMTPMTDTVDAAMPVGDLVRTLRSAGRHAAVVADGGRVVGIVTEGDLIRHPRQATVTVGSIASHDQVCVTPVTTVFDANQRLLQEGVRQLPVIEDGQLREMFTSSRCAQGQRDRGGRGPGPARLAPGLPMALRSQVVQDRGKQGP